MPAYALVLTSSAAAPTDADRTDRGSVTIELVILAPGLILALLFIIAAGRIAQAHQAVEAAARDAARHASIARDATSARTTALASAQQTLSSEGLNCPAHVTVDVSGFTRPVGQPATVTAHVTCTVNLTDITPAGIPNTTITATFTSPIDPYRSTAPAR